MYNSENWSLLWSSLLVPLTETSWGSSLCVPSFSDCHRCDMLLRNPLAGIEWLILALSCGRGRDMLARMERWVVLLVILISVLVAAGVRTEHQDEFLPKGDGDIYQWSTVQSALTGGVGWLVSTRPRWLVPEVRNPAAHVNWLKSITFSGAWRGASGAGTLIVADQHNVWLSRVWLRRKRQQQLSHHQHLEHYWQRPVVAGLHADCHHPHDSLWQHVAYRFGVRPSLFALHLKLLLGVSVPVWLNGGSGGHAPSHAQCAVWCLGVVAGLLPGLALLWRHVL